MAQALKTRSTPTAAQRVCFDCGQPLPHGASECSHCGRVIRSARRDNSNAPRVASRHADPADSPADSLAALHALRARIASDAKRHNWRIVVGVVPLAAVAWWCHLNGYHDGWTIGPAVVAFFGLTILHSPNRWLFRGEYYRIPGSAYPNGDHRCIFCGNKGIWRQGEYKGNSTYARCSKCQESLFVE